MKIILLADKEQKEELVPAGQEISAELLWSDDIASLRDDRQADACIDLLFNDSRRRVDELLTLQPAIFIINSMTTPGNKPGDRFIRINGWKTFLKGRIIEACGDNAPKENAERVFLALNKKVEWVSTLTGFISARVIASIINEAYFTLEEGVSTKEEIDIAMKLGTNYPYGPFEWSKKIGLQNIHGLLTALSVTEKRYEPATLLSKEAFV